MEVNKPEAAIILKREGGKQHQSYKHENESEEKSDHYPDQMDQQAQWDEEGAFQVDGGLSGPITPEVQEILSGLAAQIEPLRRELESARAREAEFHDRAQRHPYLPIFNRFGLENEFTRVMGHIKNIGYITFMCVTVTNAEEIRRQKGRRFYEDAMVHACNVIRKVIRQDDSMGNLGGHDLGVLILASNRETITEFAQNLRDELAKQPVYHLSTPIALEVSISGVMMHNSFTLSAAIDALDHERPV